MSAWLTAVAVAELLYIDAVSLRGFHAVRRVVVSTHTRQGKADPADIEPVVHAMKTACLVYFRRARCLHRSAVVTRLLRRRGINAELVVGCHLLPVTAHAWVEVAGKVVSDYQNGMQHMHIVDRW